MGKIENDALRKIKNEHFVKAFKFIAQRLRMGQGKLAESIGSKSSYISMYKKGQKPVPEETIERLIALSCKEPGLQIYREYLYGNSDIMLFANVSDEEIAEAELRKSNPDYDAMKNRREKKEKEILDMIKENGASYHVDEGSMINMTISAQMGYIESLKHQVEDARANLEREKKSAEESIEREKRNADERIADLKSQIADLRAQLDDKDAIIEEQKQRLIDYRRIIDTNNLLDKAYPFPVGTAEGENMRKFK